VFALHTFVK